MPMMYQSCMLVTRNHRLVPRSRLSHAIKTSQVSAATALETILARRFTGMDRAGNMVMHYVDRVGDTTLSNKLAIAACVDPAILKDVEYAEARFDNTPDERGTTPAMIFAQRVRSTTVHLIEQSAALGVHYDPDLRDVHTISLADYARQNDKENGRKETVVLNAVRKAALRTMPSAILKPQPATKSTIGNRPRRRLQTLAQPRLL